MKLDNLHGDLQISLNGKTIETDNSILEKSNFRQYLLVNPNDIILSFGDPISSSNKININIDKQNTSFDFAEKFREFLINGEWRNNENLISFIDSSSGTIGKLIYERIQNFIYNNVNIDTCHYNNLIEYYDTYGIEIDKMFINGIPEKLHYLINILSLPKQYYKSSFYNMVVKDQTIKGYDNISSIRQLEEFNDLITRKYFDNFYENVAYPIIKKELYNNREDKEIFDYINKSTVDVYDELIENENSEYIFLNYIANVIDDETYNNICNYMTAQFLKMNPDISLLEKTGVSSNYISSKYFKKLLKANLSYKKNSNGELPSIKMEEDNSSGEKISLINGTPTISGINYESPNIDDIINMFEIYYCSRYDFINTLKIRLCAKKLANACNSICNLRSEIKELRLKLSKVGTAALIEKMISDFIFDTLSKKVGLTNKKMVASDLAKIFEKIAINGNNPSDEESFRQKSFSDILNAEQKTIGIEFEQYLNNLSELVEKLKVDVVEYYDTTLSYLNIIPDNKKLTENKFYNERIIVCPEYLNVNGETVYSDFENKENIEFYTNAIPTDGNFIEDFRKKLTQCATGDEASGYIYYFKGGQCKLSEKYGFKQILDENNQYLVQPINSFVFKVAKNLNDSRTFYNVIKKRFELNYINPYTGENVYKIIDTFDRLLTLTKNLFLVDQNGSEIIKWTNEKQITNFGSFLIEENILLDGSYEYSEYLSKIKLLKSKNKDFYEKYDVSGEPEYYGFYYDLNKKEPINVELDYGGNVITSLGSDVVFVWVLKKEHFSDTGTVAITEINEEKTYTLSFYVKLINGNIVDSVSEPEYYILNEINEYVIDETGEVVNIDSQYNIYDSTGLILNQYESDLESFYKISNCVIAYKEKSVEVPLIIEGNEPFWTDLKYNELYGDKTVDDEANIVRFYKKIGLINDNLSDNYKISDDLTINSFSKDWILARTNIIRKLKSFWRLNAQHTWYDEASDLEKVSEGKLTTDDIRNLKNMDIAYHSNIGKSLEYSSKIKLNNSITNLENWSNNTVAIHPCVWNLVEATYESYIKLYSISLFNEETLDLIYSDTQQWPRQCFDEYTGKMLYSNIDPEGLFAVHSYDINTKENNQKITNDETDGINVDVHNVNYWRNYSHDLFSYSTHYEVSKNETLNGAHVSRYIDFDGPFNYEALLNVIDMTFDSSNKEFKLLSADDLKTYYIDIEL